MTVEWGVEVRTPDGVWRVDRGQQLALGRDEHADVRIDAPVVSRTHAVVESTPDGFQLRDTSRNGLFVDGGRQSVIAIVGPVTVHLGAADGPAVQLEPTTYQTAAAPAPSPRPLSIVARAISVATGTGALVDNVSFALERGSLLAIVGPSGSGKSTLLRALSGAGPADTGSVQLDGRDLYADYDALRGRIGFVPQEDLVQPDLRVGASLRYAAELRFPPSVPASDRDARVDEVMTQLGLWHRRAAKVNSLSGGERKRVSVATELLTRPSLLLLDEPTSGLDPGLERSVMQQLRSLADGDRTVVCVTHALASLHLCDRVLFLAPGGQVAFFGPPQHAASYFARPDLQTVFQALSEQTGWAEYFARSPLHDEFVQRPLAVNAQVASPDASTTTTPPAGIGPRGPATWWRQFSTTSRRYARSLVADRRNLFIILATGPLLGLVLLLRLPTDQLHSLAPGDLPDFSRASAPLMLLALAMTQLGINLSARQIVRELPLFRRERAIGLSLTAYVASKFAVLAGIGALQALLCVAIALARQGGPEEGVVLSSGHAELIVVFFVTWLAGMTLGLLCSALSTSEARLNLVLPAILAFQTLAVTGTAVANLPSAPVLDQAEYVASASWGFNAAASTVELNRLNALNDALIEADTAARTNPAGTVIDRLNPFNLPTQLEPRGNPDFDHDTSTWSRAMFVLLGLTALALVGTALALRRYDPL